MCVCVCVCLIYYYQFAFEIINISCINYFCIKFIPSFYASIWEAVSFYVSLAYFFLCPLVVLSSYTHRSSLSIFSRPEALYTIIKSPLSLLFTRISSFSLESFSYISQQVICIFCDFINIFIWWQIICNPYSQIFYIHSSIHFPSNTFLFVSFYYSLFPKL